VHSPSNDPEFIHQLRVALRRLRSALRVFKPAAQVRFGAELKWLTGVLGEARDWDVLVAETLAATAEKLRRWRAGKKNPWCRQAEARHLSRGCQGCARSPRQAQLVIELARWLGAGDEFVPVPESAANEPAAGDQAGVEELPAKTSPLNELPDFASREIRRRHRRLLHDSVALAILDPGAPPSSAHRCQAPALCG